MLSSTFLGYHGRQPRHLDEDLPYRESSGHHGHPLDAAPAFCPRDLAVPALISSIAYESHIALLGSLTWPAGDAQTTMMLCPAVEFPFSELNTRPSSSCFLSDPGFGLPSPSGGWSGVLQRLGGACGKEKKAKELACSTEGTFWCFSGGLTHMKNNFIKTSPGFVGAGGVLSG